MPARQGRCDWGRFGEERWGVECGQHRLDGCCRVGG